MPSRRVSALSVARLQEEIGGKSKHYVQNTLKQAVGRLVIGAELLDRLAALPEAGNSLLGVEAIRPAVRYIKASSVKQIQERGITYTDPRLALPPYQAEKGTIRDPQTLLAAIRRSQKLDAKTIGDSVPTIVRGVEAEKVYNAPDRYSVHVMVEDIESDFYEDGYVFRGERGVLGPLETPHFSLNPLQPSSEPPLQAITVAEAHIRHKSPEVRQEVITMFCAYVSKQLSETIDVSYLSLVTET